MQLIIETEFESYVNKVIFGLNINFSQLFSMSAKKAHCGRPVSCGTRRRKNITVYEETYDQFALYVDGLNFERQYNKLTFDAGLLFLLRE